MPRQNMLFAALATATLRNKIWARSVKKTLLPSQELRRPYAHLIEDAFFETVMKYNQKNKNKAQINLSKVTISNGKWMGWWGGAHPIPQYIDIFNLIAPGASKWFEQRVSVYPDSPIHLLLYSIDLWASEVDSREKAFSLTLAIEKSWAPQLRKRLLNSNSLNGWTLGLLPKITLPSDLPYHYRSLEPASLIIFMVLLGDWLKIDETDYFERWVFDLVSVSALTRTILNPNFERSSVLGGDTVDLSTLVEQTFILNPTYYLSDHERFKRVWKLDSHKSFKVSHSFPEIMLKAAILYRDKLLDVGVNQEEIAALDSNLYWLDSN